jgi:predicted GH43/DUF377 family glycosyl hydrolase
MPRRDLLVHWVVAAVAAIAFIAALSGLVSFWLGLLGAAVFLLVAYNLLFSKWTVFPYDCILSAHSQDGLNWVRDEGVRIDVGGKNKSSQVYYPDVVCLDGGGYRMYYRGGGDASVILSAISTDGMSWQEEGGERLGIGQTWQRLMAPDVLHIGALFCMYFTAYYGTGWKIYWVESVDGVKWESNSYCIGDWNGKAMPNIIDPCVVEVGGGYRLYCTCLADTETYICYSNSLDGQMWSDLERCMGYQGEGIRYARNPNVVAIDDGRWRMYFSESSQISALNSRIVSAVSSDGVQWVREAGIRIGPGGQYDGQGVFCPDVIVVNGGLKMYYGGYWKKHWLAPYTFFRHRAKREPA